MTKNCKFLLDELLVEYCIFLERLEIIFDVK